VAAYDGPSALAALSTHRPDLVLLDLGMAGMDGYEVARRMRAIAPESDLMLVAITGRGDDEAQRAALAAGFDRHLVKPVTADCVAALLQERAPAQ
jgi:CheY-like chemotaxis protein